MSPALKTLEVLINNDDSKKRKRRLFTFLRAPNDEPTPDWAFYIPLVFNDALDIRLTENLQFPEPVLTQGSLFSFAPGDIFYDSAAGYGNWNEALKTLRTCLQISDATPVMASAKAIPRNPGSVTFVRFAPNADRTALTRIGSHTVTQDLFVRILIAGVPADLDHPTL